MAVAVAVAGSGSGSEVPESVALGSEAPGSEVQPSEAQLWVGMGCTPPEDRSSSPPARCKVEAGSPHACCRRSMGIDRLCRRTGRCRRTRCLPDTFQDPWNFVPRRIPRNIQEEVDWVPQQFRPQ